MIPRLLVLEYDDTYGSAIMGKHSSVHLEGVRILKNDSAGSIPLVVRLKNAIHVTGLTQRLFSVMAIFFLVVVVTH
jgi:hypothetical protein